jgi:hypothetical protein
VKPLDLDKLADVLAQLPEQTALVGDVLPEV